jgi:hypothetical protein
MNIFVVLGESHVSFLPIASGQPQSTGPIHKSSPMPEKWKAERRSRMRSSRGCCGRRECTRTCWRTGGGGSAARSDPVGFGSLCANASSLSRSNSAVSEVMYRIWLQVNTLVVTVESHALFLPIASPNRSSKNREVQGSAQHFPDRPTTSALA